LVRQAANTEPSGWAFELLNEFYPVSTTRHGNAGAGPGARSDPVAQKPAPAALDWLFACSLSMADGPHSTPITNWEFLNKVPFADHNAMLDPTCPYHRAVLEALASPASTAISRRRRGVDWLVAISSPTEAWYGRWGVAYIYGAASPCAAWRRRESDREAHVLRARMASFHTTTRWRMGRKLRSYDNGTFTPPTDTVADAWAIMA